MNDTCCQEKKRRQKAHNRIETQPTNLMFLDVVEQEIIKASGIK